MSSVICNGAPKSGTHALEHAVQLLGFPTENGHLPVGSDMPEGPHIHIYRHPRNVMISWVRAARHDYRQGYLMAAMRGWYCSASEQSLSEYLGTFADWIDDSGVVSVRFEDLIADAETRRIAEFLGVGVPDDAAPVVTQTISSSPGLSPSNLDVLSDWRNPKWLWDDAVEAVWAEIGGSELERRFGYV